MRRFPEGPSGNAPARWSGKQRPFSNSVAIRQAESFTTAAILPNSRGCLPHSVLATLAADLQANAAVGQGTRASRTDSRPKAGHRAAAAKAESGWELGEVHRALLHPHQE